MIKYTSTRQLSIEEFRTPFYYGLDKNNRWARLAQQIPWDEFAKIYAKALCEDFGRPAIDARIVIGAMIIKHKKGLADEETIEEIKENPYLQFFIGYEEFSHEQPFDPSLFVTLRERLGIDAYEELNQAFIRGAEEAEESIKPAQKKSTKKKNPNSDNPSSSESDRQGKLIIDAAVAPQDIKFPTDLELLNDAREQTESLIDALWVSGPGKRKPRTYRQNARRDYLSIAKKKRKSTKELRAGIRKQLNYIKRNIKTIKMLLQPELGKQVVLSNRHLRVFWIVQEFYRQQKHMYDNKIHQVSDRIVSLSQPYVRPIVRGKSGKEVEFGAKFSASFAKGYAYLDHLSWDAFNESTDLKGQVEKYNERFGFYPEVVIGDTIYGTRENRAYLKSKGIRFSGRALGRPIQLTREEARALRKQRKHEARLRNRIEGKFGEVKRRYGLERVMAKRRKTSESWIAATFFVMNIAFWLRQNLFSLFLKCCRYGHRKLDFFKERSKIDYIQVLAY